MFKPKAAGAVGLAAVTCAVILGYGFIKIIMPKRKRQGQSVVKKPEKWIRVGKIDKLIIYPIKSCQGIEVDEAKLTPLGLQGLTSPEFFRDRMFVIVDSKGTFQTQRQFPTFALVNAVVTEDNKLILHAPEIESIACNLETLHPATHPIRVFSDHFSTKDILDLGDAIGTWLDKYLQQTGLRIIYHAKNSTGRKMTTTHKKFALFAPEDTGAFQDETSYLLHATETIDALKSALEPGNAVSYKNLRPNFLVDGIPEPFSEDDWSFIRIGNKSDGPILKVCMPCARCRLSTVDPSTGIFSAEGEPLKTIRTLKRVVADAKTTELVKNQAILGTHFGLYEGDGATVKIGDSIYVALL